MKILNGTKKMIAIYLTIIFFIGLDRFLKVLALTNPERQFNLIGEIIKFGFKGNYYIAFSLPLAGRMLEFFLILLVAALISLALFYWFNRQPDKVPLLSMVILGSGSNLLDRFKYGYVIDYLDLKYFTVFNLADAMIVAGVILLIVAFNKKKV
jgi:signal peptidase II